MPRVSSPSNVLTFSEFLSDRGKTAYEQSWRASEKVEHLMAAEVSDYFDLQQMVKTSNGEFSLSEMIRVWRCLVALALTAESWAETIPRALYMESPVAQLGRPQLVQLIQECLASRADVSEPLINQYTLANAPHQDLFYSPLVPLANGLIGLATKVILSSRMQRNIFRIAVRESELDQKEKGQRPLVALQKSFEHARFQAVLNYPAVLGNKVSTDIDIIALKDGVLFVGQSKIVIIPDTHYEVWLVWEKLVSAADQLRKSLDAIDADSSVIKHRLGMSEKPQRVVPFIITSA